MSFWEIEDIDSAATGSFSSGGGFEVIPAKTQLLAAPDEAKWAKDRDGNDIISIRWAVLQPEQYKNRKIFHRLRVTDSDEKKAARAKKMLAAIDHNAKAGLLSSGEAPTDATLQKLCGKPQYITVMVFEPTDGGDPMNWVSAVAPKVAGGSAPKAAPAKPAKPAAQLDDEIPF